MKFLKDEKGMSVTELILGLFLSGLIMVFIFCFLSPISGLFNTTVDISQRQLYADEILNFIHNQIVFASNVSVLSNNSTPEYINNISVKNGKMTLQGMNVYGYASDYEIELRTEIKKMGSLFVEIAILDEGKEVYKTSEDVKISFIYNSNAYVKGEVGKVLINPVISYDTTEIIAYDISTIAYELRENMRKFAINWTLLSEQERRNKYNGVWYANNSTFRNELRKEKYSNVWPEFPKDKDGNYPLGIDSSTPMYIQVYIHYPNNVDNANADIVVFATRTQGDNWYTSLIYDHEELQWYMKNKGGWSCNQPWSVIKNEIHSDRWTAVFLK